MSELIRLPNWVQAAEINEMLVTGGPFGEFDARPFLDELLSRVQASISPLYDDERTEFGMLRERGMRR